jgi:hypothetical protein
MAFTPNIPTADESLNDSRPEISGNFQALRESFSVDFTGDHVDPNDADAGKHWWVRMPDVGADIPPGADNQLAFFVKTVSGASQIFYKAAGAAGAEIQVTTRVTTGASGRSVPIIGGLCMKVGKVNTATGSATKNWLGETGSDFASAPIYYNVVAPDPNFLTKFARPTAVSTTKFKYDVAGGPLDVYYIAIGFPG